MEIFYQVMDSYYDFTTTYNFKNVEAANVYVEKVNSADYNKLMKDIQKLTEENGAPMEIVNLKAFKELFKFFKK